MLRARVKCSLILLNLENEKFYSTGCGHEVFNYQSVADKCGDWF